VTSRYPAPARREAYRERTRVETGVAKVARPSRRRLEVPIVRPPSAYLTQTGSDTPIRAFQVMLSFSDAGPNKVSPRALGPASEKLQGTKPRVAREGRCHTPRYGDLHTASDVQEARTAGAT
jgi:hypothetical protein